MNILLRFDDHFGKFKEIPAEFLKIRSSQKLFEFIVEKHHDYLLKVFNEELAKTYLNVNTYEGEIYFSKEKFDSLITLFFHWYAHQYMIYSIEEKKTKVLSEKESISFIKKIFSIKEFLEKKSVESKFHYPKLLELLESKEN